LARAQSADEAARADALFAEGRGLMVRGEYEKACPKFAEAERLRHGVGTLLNLADCYERLGKTASAARMFQEATRAAEAAHDARAEIARDRARALEVRLVRLTIDTSRVAGVTGLEVLRDRTPLQRESWNTAVVLDPGRYVVEVRAPGHESFTANVVLAADNVVLEIPAFVEQQAEPTPVTPPPPPPASRQVEHHDLPPHDAGLSTQRKVALGLGVLGVAGVAVGSVYGFLSLSAHNEAEPHCKTGSGDDCDDQGYYANEKAIERGNISTVAFAVGGTALGAAAVLWLTSAQPDSSRSEARLRLLPAVGPRGGALLLTGGLP
jgi:tetratricopeptide (TPR) repeat protein